MTARRPDPAALCSLPGRPTPADVTLAYLCAIGRSRPTLTGLYHAWPCRFCAIDTHALAAWADGFGRPADPAETAG